MSGLHGMVHGVDVASFQGPPTRWRGAAGPIDWAGVKITEHKTDGTTYVNPDAAADWAFLRVATRGRLAYLFGHPGSSPQASASAFLAQLEHLGVRDGDAVALDLEVTDGRSPAEVDAWSLRVAGIIETALDRPVVLYTFLSFAQAGNCRSLGHLPLWIADPSSPAGHPRVPAPWKTWAIHQYAITGGIDRDTAAYPSVAAMAAALGKRPPKEPPVTVTDLTTDGGKSLVKIASNRKVGAAHILRLTLARDGTFAPGLAAYINHGDLTAAMPEGIRLRVPQ